MLPAPTTTATWTPLARTAASSRAIMRDRLGILPVGPLAEQRLARELDQDAVKRPAAVAGWGGFAHLGRIERDRRPVRNLRPRARSA